MYWFLYDSNGVIKEAQQVNVTEWTNLNGYTGALSVDETDTTAQDAFINKDHYQVQNNVLTKTVTDAQLLTEAQTNQISLINSGLNQTLTNGFVSKSTSHTYITTTNGQANMEGDLKRFELDTTLTSVQFYTVDAGWVAHTQAQLQSAFLDGGKWKDAQYAQAQTLISNIKAATTVSTVEAIVWAEATY